MKKILFTLILGLGLLSFGATAANAAYCISLGAFCDRLQVDLDADNNLYGSWDSDCDGLFETPVLGALNGNKADIIGTLALADFRFQFNTSTWLFDMWGYDWVNPPWVQQSSMPFSFTVGTCPPLDQATGAASTD